MHQLSDILRGEFKPQEYGQIILPFILERLLGDLSDDIRNAFDFDRTVTKLKKSNIYDLLVSEIAKWEINTNNPAELGDIFESILLNFSEQTTGEHYTPKEVVDLTFDLLLNEDFTDIDEVYDPTCGTGGALGVAQHRIKNVKLYGQEINVESHAIAKSYLKLIQNDGRIHLGNTLTDDGFKDNKFKIMFSNPPYGVDWKKFEKVVKNDPRFTIGQPRTSDGSLLFVQHLISKMHPDGCRIGVILSASPLFTGDAGSGESEIRKWIIENDLLETIIALPHSIFVGTQIGTFIWILTNKKKRKGKVRLINAVDYYQKIRKPLGKRRNEMTEEHRTKIKELYNMIETHENYKDCDISEFKIIKNNKIGYAIRWGMHLHKEQKSEPRMSDEEFLAKIITIRDDLNLLIASLIKKSEGEYVTCN